jgi:hypothetical protein
VGEATELRVPVHRKCLDEVLSDQAKLQALVDASMSFREFLNYWNFVDLETGQQRVLGETLWAGQEQVVEAMENVQRFYALKARKLGFTTLEVAYDGWVTRFRDVNARVHLFSRRDDAAKELLEAVRYGLKRLPEWMQLPFVKDTVYELKLQADEDDVRHVKSYPTSEETAVEATCTHAHVDEWARMGNPERVWQAIEPSFAGSAHIITTGRGPVNFSATFWKKCLAQDTDFVPVFVSALNRPDRDENWLSAKRRSMTEEAFRQEFPMNWTDALFAGGRFTFRAADVDAAGTGIGPTEPEPGHKYVKAWDIGRHQDAAVGTTIDVTRSPSEVVDYIRLRGVPYPALQKTIERVHDAYPGPVFIEANGPGEAVAENLEGVKKSDLHLFNTTAKSKARILEELQVALENRHLRWDRRAWPQLDEEVRGYQVPDDSIVQDSVMSLAIANAHTDAPYRSGRVGKVMTW